MKRRWPKYAAIGIAVCYCVVLMNDSARATINVITIGDPVIPIDRDLVTYTSSYPAQENPFKAIDNLNLAPTGTKYTNFGRFSAGFTIQPSIGSTTIKAFEIDTANDNEPHDPASYELYGSNDLALSSADNSDGSLENWTLISSGPLSLPSGRRTLGPIVPVTNNTAYNLYRMVFPTLKLPNAATVMQFGEVSFFQNTDGSDGDFINTLDDIRAIKIPTPAGHQQSCDNDGLQETPVTMYNCPSRRGPSRHEATLAYLMDYAAVVPSPSRSQIGDLGFNRYLKFSAGYDDLFGCELREFWGAPNAPRLDFASKESLGAAYRGFWGTIVRSDLWVDDNGVKHTTNFYTKISYRRLTDGTSKTLVISEKRLAPSKYLVGDWHDDRGWSDGWDPDTLRYTMCTFGPDQELKLGNDTEKDLAGYRLGSAHSSGMAGGFADGSTRFLSFDMDQELLNRLAHRSDGEGGESALQ